MTYKPRKPVYDRLMSKVDKTATCWLWTARLDRGGYGQTTVLNRPALAHRAVYELLVGPIPAGLQLDHLCRVRRCVNPEHLEPVTPLENSRRGCAGDVVRARAAAQTHCKHGHAYDEKNTYRRKSGQRDCRTCIRIRVRRYKASLRGAA